MNLTLSPEQKAYRDAKQHYEHLLREVDPIIQHLLDETPVETDAEIDAYCEKEAAIHEQYGTPQARHALAHAEDALLAWGLAVLKRQPGYNPTIEDVVKSPVLSFRQRALDLMMRL